MSKQQWWYGEGKGVCGCVVALSALVVGCGEDDAVSYEREVAPLFAARCTPCHASDNTVNIIDIQDPFTQDEPPGLVGGVNAWSDQHLVPPFTVVPYEPDASFLLEKVSNQELLPGFCDPSTRDPEGPPCPIEEAGQLMPPKLGMTEQNIADIRQWILDGAQDDERFRNVVMGIFGGRDRTFNYFGERKTVKDAGICGYCHYSGSPYPPDLWNPFDPELGIVGVSSIFRPDLKLVVANKPEESFLMMKLEQPVRASAELGARMPIEYPPLDEPQVDLLRRWISEGARDN